MAAATDRRALAGDRLGTGIFTALIASLCAPAKIVGIDPAQSLIARARRQVETTRAEFWLGDVRDLPFQNATFDVLASSLVLNFVPDRARALSEICRVARPLGVIGACVWDFAAERSPSGPLRRTMRRLGIEVPPIPGTEASGISPLRGLFEGKNSPTWSPRLSKWGSFQNFDDFWNSQTPNSAPLTNLIAAMTPKDQDDLRTLLRSELQHWPDGAVKYSARANAIKGQRVPRPREPDHFRNWPMLLKKSS